MSNEMESDQCENESHRATEFLPFREELAEIRQDPAEASGLWRGVRGALAEEVFESPTESPVLGHELSWSNSDLLM